MERRPLRRFAARHAVQMRHPRLAPRPSRLFALRHPGQEIPLRLVRIRLRLQRILPGQRCVRMPSAPDRCGTYFKLHFYSTTTTIASGRNRIKLKIVTKKNRGFPQSLQPQGAHLDAPSRARRTVFVLGTKKGNQPDQPANHTY